MIRRLSVLASAFVIVLAITPEPVTARPQYLKAFAETYPNLKEDGRVLKCSICHCGESKKSHNDYGEAVEKALRAKNVKVPAQVVAALKAVEKDPSSEPGKTFGDLIDEGRSPGKCPEKNAK